MTSLAAGKINIAEQLTLMAIGKQRHFDFTQAAAIMLNASVDSQISKGLEGVKSIPQNVVQTASSTAINYALNGRLNWEQVAAQMLSNKIVESIQPMAQNGMQRLPHQESVKHFPAEHKTPAPKALVTKKHHSNATKHNVHRFFNASPDEFKQRVDIHELMEDYEKAKQGFSFEEQPLESYIGKHSKYASSTNSIGKLFYNGIKKSAISMLTAQIPATVLKQADNAAGGPFVYGVLDNNIGMAEFIMDPVKTSTNIANAAKYLYYQPHALDNVAIDTWNRFNNADTAGKVGMVEYGVGSFLGGGVIGKGGGSVVKMASRSGMGFRLFNKAEAIVPNKSFKPGEAAAHFEKHGTEISEKFGISSYTKEQYIQDANHVIQHGQFVPELNGYVLTPSGKGSALAPFVGLDRATGEITTLHLKPVSFFERKAPSLGWSAKPRSEITDTIGVNRELGYRAPYRSNF